MKTQKNEVTENSSIELNNNNHQQLIDNLINKILNPEKDETIITQEEIDSIPIAPTFSEMIVTFMNNKRLKNVDVYKEARIDRRLFSKIISKRNYQPSKETVINLCLAMHLTNEEAKKLMDAAGFSFSHSKLSNLVIESFLRNQNFNLDNLYEIFDFLGLYDEL